MEQDFELVAGAPIPTDWQPAVPEVVTDRFASTYADVWESIYGPSEQELAALDHYCSLLSRTNFIPDGRRLPKRVVVRPVLPRLPMALVPWDPLLKKWKASSSVHAKKVHKTAWRYDLAEGVAVSTPCLPENFAAWFVSVGVDPGPDVSDRGHTGLLLVAAPKAWKPNLTECLLGPYGERFVVRLDGLLMRVPRPWWEDYACGALGAGSLYFVTPVQPST